MRNVRQTQPSIIDHEARAIDWDSIKLTVATVSVALRNPFVSCAASS